MPKSKQHLLVVTQLKGGWAVLVDGLVVEKLRTRERALSWAELWQQTALQKEAYVELVIYDEELVVGLNTIQPARRRDRATPLHAG